MFEIEVIIRNQIINNFCLDQYTIHAFAFREIVKFQNCESTYKVTFWDWSKMDHPFDLTRSKLHSADGSS